MRGRVVLALVALVTIGSLSLRSHEIPNEVTIHTFLKPEGARLMFLVRAPMKAMRDMDVPRRGGAYPGYIDLERIDPVLRDAATQWIGDFVKLYENDRQLPYPEVLAARISLPADRSFESYEQALANINGPRLPVETSRLRSRLNPIARSSRSALD
jgi:hypothetical protein